MARGRGMRAVVNSYKNVIDTSGGLSAATVSLTVVGVAVAPGTLVTTSNQIPIGGRVTSIYYSLYIYSDAIETTSPLVDIFWWKRVADSDTIPVPGQTGTSINKRWIFHEEKGLSGNRTTGMPMVIKGVIKIPRAYQRFANGDDFEMRILSPVAGFFCAKHIYRVQH